MYMNVKQSAEYLGCSERYVRWLFDTGQIKAGKVANQWRTKAAEIDEFVLSGGEVMTKTAMERRRKPGRPKKEVTA